MNIQAFERNENQYWPMLSVSPNYSVIYWMAENPYRRELTETDKFNLKFNSSFGMLSDKAKSKIRKSVNYLIYISDFQDICLVKEKKQIRFKINFITLTLPAPQKHSDIEIRKECLHQFITELQHKYGMKHYLWKAEKQKNGNIHFHFTTNVFIHWQELRDIWNRIVEKLGYVTDYQNRMKTVHKNGFCLNNNLLQTWPEIQQRAAYEFGLKTNWRSPNSTDVHAVKNIQDLSAYISEYFTKAPLDEIELIAYKEAVDSQKKLKVLIEIAKNELSLVDEKNTADRNHYNNIIATHTSTIANYQKVIDKFSHLFVTCDIWNLSRSLSNIKISVDLTNEIHSNEINEFVTKNPSLVDSLETFSIVKCHIKKLSDLGCKSIKNEFDAKLNEHMLKYSK